MADGWGLSFGGGSGSGVGFVLGPAPNLFADDSEDALTPLGRATGPARTRAAAELLRDDYTNRKEVYASTWDAKSPFLTGATRITLTSDTAYPAAPWGTGNPWMLPAGTVLTHGVQRVLVNTAVTATWSGTGTDAGQVHFTNIPLRTALTAGMAGGSVVGVTPTLHNWIDRYDGLGLNIRLVYYVGSITYAVHQIYTAGAGWVDNASLTSIVGPPGSGATFTGFGANTVPRIKADGTPEESGLVVTDTDVTYKTKRVPRASGALADEVVPRVASGELVASGLTDDGTDALYKSALLLRSGHAGSEATIKSLASAQITDSHIRTVAAAAVATAVGALTIPTNAEIDARSDARIKHAVTTGTRTGITVGYDDANDNVDFNVTGGGTGTFAAPHITAFSVRGLGAKVDPGEGLTVGNHTIDYTLQNGANVAGDLTLVVRYPGASSDTSIATNVSATATAAIVNIATALTLANAGDTAVFTLSGTDTRGDAFSRTFTSVAADIHEYIYYGATAATTAAGVDRTASTMASVIAPTSATNIGDLVIPSFTSNSRIAFLIPADIGHLTDIVHDGFPGQLGAFPRVDNAQTINSHAYDVYLSSQPQFPSRWSGKTVTLR